MSPPTTAGVGKGRQAGKKKAGVGRDGGRVVELSHQYRFFLLPVPPLLQPPQCYCHYCNPEVDNRYVPWGEGLSTAGSGWGLGSNSPGGFGNANCRIAELNGKFQVHLPNLKPQLTNDKDVESRKNSFVNSLKDYVGFFF